MLRTILSSYIVYDLQYVVGLNPKNGFRTRTGKQGRGVGFYYNTFLGRKNFLCRLRESEILIETLAIM